MKSRKARKFGFFSIASLGGLAALLTNCAYTAPYRPTELASNASLSPDQLVIVTISAVEHRPGQRRAFFRDTRQVLAELPAQDGLLGHAFRFEIIGNEAWTVTAWLDQASQDAFVRSPTHRAAARRSAETAQNIRFVTLQRPLSSLPPDWREILDLMSKAPARY
jgi:heme-degrading monooxygenase HmoA